MVGHDFLDPALGAGPAVCRDPPLEILYADRWLVAVAKPSGLFVHRTPLDPSARSHALQQLRDQLGVPVYPAHRLDRATSGALLFALDPATHRELSMAFESGAVGKRYLAIVRGWPPSRVRIDYPLRRLSDDGELLSDGTAPQPAVTELLTLACVELPIPIDRYPAARYALVELRPATGRRHQLRRHLKHVNYPIIGDTSYGKGEHNRLFRQRFGSARLLLHAQGLDLPHPATGRALSVRAPPPADFAQVAAALGFGAALAGLPP